MNRPHFRRHPRPTDPEPYTRLDRLDGLPQRVAGGTLATGGVNVIATGDRIYHLDGLHTRYDAVLDSGPADPEPTRTRYDAEWPDVLAAETPALVAMQEKVNETWAHLYAADASTGGDLAAMAAPLTGMARDDLGTYAEPVVVHIEADVSRFRDEMAHVARTVAELTDPPQPRGRHRQTDPADLILADLRDLDGLS